MLFQAVVSTSINDLWSVGEMLFEGFGNHSSVSRHDLECIFQA